MRRKSFPIHVMFINMIHVGESAAMCNIVVMCVAKKIHVHDIYKMSAQVLWIVT